jgi:hypothetical protein
MHLFFPAAWRSLPAASPPAGTLARHSLHYADANDAEIGVNEEFLKKIEFLFGPRPTTDISLSVKMFIDFILEARKLRRLNSRGTIFEAPDLAFSLRGLLLHTPLQLWPFPQEGGVSLRIL